MLIEFYRHGDNVRYYIDNETYEVFKSGAYSKLLPVKKHNGKYGVSVNLFCFYDKDSERLRNRQMYLSHIVGRYVFNAKRKYIFVYKDGDKYNFTKDNIEIVYLTDLCPNWKRIEDSCFYVSSNGDVYCDEHSCLIPPIKDCVGYYQINVNKKHYKRSHLVWKYFGDCEIKQGYVIDHIDNNPSHDNIENLQCITNRQNIVKEIKRELPTGVTLVDKTNVRYRSTINYTINNIVYENVILGHFKSPIDAGKCYQRALSLVEQGIDPIKHGDNPNIKYLFKDDSWYFLCPQKKGSDRKYKGFKSYDEAFKKYIEVVDIDASNETDIERYLRKGVLSFGYYEKTYKIKKLKYGDEEFIKVIEFYRKCRDEGKMELFMDSLETIKNNIRIESLKVKNQIKLKEHEDKVIRKELTRIEREKRIAEKIEEKKAVIQRKYDFAKNSNYEKNSYNDAYTINVPHIDGRRYYLHSFMSKEIVDEIDVIMNQHKYSVDFPEWFERFKEEELGKYIERDKASRTQSFNTQMGYKGYGWFSPRKSWRVRRKINGHTYCMGYYDNEECCKYMVKECDKAIAEGRFEEWYANIELHKLYVRKLFNDGKLSNNNIIARGVEYGLVEKRIKEKKPIVEKKVIEYHPHDILQIKDGVVINRFKAYKEAAKQFNNSDGYKFISKCCNGLKKDYKGYEWRFE